MGETGALSIDPIIKYQDQFRINPCIRDGSSHDFSFFKQCFRWMLKVAFWNRFETRSEVMSDNPEDYDLVSRRLGRIRHVFL